MVTTKKRTALVFAGLAVCNVLVVSAALAQGVSFIARRDFEAGSSPLSVAVGDFNGDGVQDLAVVVGPGAAVLLGNGDGTFQSVQNFAAGSNPRSVAVGDFNGDGLQDLGVANFSSNNVSVLLGNGDGSFQGAQNFGAGNAPRSVAVGNFNGDGLQDLAVANAYSFDVSVLINNTQLTLKSSH